MRFSLMEVFTSLEVKEGGAEVLNKQLLKVKKKPTCLHH